jgi:Methyltransferase domain
MAHGDVQSVKPLFGMQEHRYYLPIDEEEMNCWELGHLCWMRTTRLVFPSSQKMLAGTFLDLGTGDGRWVQDVATIYHEVTGTDLHYLEIPETPVKSSFEVDDCESDFAARPDPVSLVNLRDSYLWVRDLHKLVRRVHHTLRSGGWLQNCEVRLSDWVSNKLGFNTWVKNVLFCAGRLRIQLHSEKDMHDALSHLGFQDYCEEACTWQTLPPSPENLQVLGVVRGMVSASSRILIDGGCSTGQTLEILQGAWLALEEADCQVTLRAHVCWARKA